MGVDHNGPLPAANVVNRKSQRDDMMTEQELLEKYGKQVSASTSEKSETVMDKMRQKMKCSRRAMTNKLFEMIPIMSWLPRYPVRKWLSGDLACGLTLGIVTLPQCMAYASLASLPAINGLFLSFVPVLVYAIFGTSRQISIGTFAIVSIMVGDSLTKHVPDNYCDQFNAANSSSFDGNNTLAYGGNDTVSGYKTPNDCSVDMEREKYAIAISLVVSIIYFLMYLLRLGFVSVYLSTHMISAFTCAGGFHVGFSQLDKLFDIRVERQVGFATLVKKLIAIFTNIETINWYTTGLSVACVVFLFIGKEYNARNKEKLPFPLPWELVVVIICTIASYFGQLHDLYDVSVVGDIPTGIRTTVPETNYITAVIVEAIPISIVGYAISISMARLFADKHGYEINSNQELFAFMMASFVGSFFGCYPAASSLSRSVIQDEAGGNTQIASMISATFILIVLLWIAPLFEQLPRAALAAIIVVNLKRLLMKFNQLPALWKVSKIDVAIWVVTWASVFFLGVDMGLLIGIGISILSVTIRTQIASGDVMVPVTSEQRLYRSATRFEADLGGCQEKHDDVIIFGYRSAIHFANKDSFKSQLSSVIGYEPAKEKALREKKKNKQQQQPEQDTATSSSSNISNVTKDNCYVNQASTIEMDEMHEKKVQDDATEEVASEATTVVAVKKDYTCVILDLQCCTFVDNDGSKLLLELYKDFRSLQVSLLFASCDYSVYETLLSAGFDEVIKDDQELFFVSIRDAHLYAIRKKLYPEEHLQ